MIVPKEFQPKIKVAYPNGNLPILEEWLMHIDHPDYLPINWCGYFVNNNYGKNKHAMQRLQSFLNGLPKKHYFTVTQYDDGILSDISRMDIKVFGSGGGRIDYPLPLVCKPHGVIESDRTMLASFTGSLTHQIRKDLLNMKFDDDYLISAKNYSITDFCTILSKSIFAICPRGYGLTSFRICEALEQGAIPVYISDKFIIPGNHEFNDYGVLIAREQLPELDIILKSISVDEIIRKQECGKRIYKEMYSFEGCKKLILDKL